VVGVSVAPHKTDTPLVVDAYAVLPRAVTYPVDEVYYPEALSNPLNVRPRAASKAFVALAVDCSRTYEHSHRGKVSLCRGT
jgi:hypothetical protein